jgi:hypothetical protein
MAAGASVCRCAASTEAHKRLSSFADCLALESCVIVGGYEQVVARGDEVRTAERMGTISQPKFQISQC